MRALLPDPERPGAWLAFEEPSALLCATTLDEVLPVLRRAEDEAAAGRVAVGYLSYEASPAFDPALVVAAAEGPLAELGIFAAPRRRDLVAAVASPRLDWRPGWTAAEHAAAVAEVRERIARGDVYQVNLTFPLEARFDGDPLALFASLVAGQPSASAAFVETRERALLSASPELFFELDGDRLVTRPMKGTRRRGRYPLEDRRAVEALATSEKERAENLMIVDMARNDLGRIARPGSVAVERLFEVETYPTVHQLTSTVGARTDAAIAEVFRALFPAASITGAPKVAACRAIRDLEPSPRGVYTGAIGRLGPGRRAAFSVAIRTVELDRRRSRARYGTGGGIVWDSDAGAEHDETRVKALVLSEPRRRFELLETMRWRPRSGVFLLERHLARLAESARYFGFRCDLEVVRAAILARVAGGEPGRHRLRLRLAEEGAVAIDVELLPCHGRTVWRLALDDRPVDSGDRFLFHKTSERRRYDEARSRLAPGVDEALLWNERGELTEATRANLVVRLDGRLWTPPVESGLLAGVYRGELLARGRIAERTLASGVWEEASEVWLVNALRGWIRVERVGTTGSPSPRS